MIRVGVLTPHEVPGPEVEFAAMAPVGAIEMLEAAIGRPVLTSNQVLLWQLLAQADATFEINGYGRLFARKP